MGKFLKAVICVAGLSGAQAADDNFDTTRCIGDDGRAAMSIAIKQSYFDDNFNLAGFTLDDVPDSDTNGYYLKTIDEDSAEWANMAISWDDVNDNIVMSYTIIPDPDGYSIGNNAFIKFAEDTVTFTCTYDRNIDVEKDFTVETQFQAQPIENDGNLVYDLTVNAGYVGETSEMVFTKRHSIAGVSASVKECKISLAADPTKFIYAIHGFEAAGVCFDTQRLDVTQTSQSGEDPIKIQYRTFRFTTDGGNLPDASGQNQTVTCKLHLDPASAPAPAPGSCDIRGCQSTEACEALGI